VTTGNEAMLETSDFIDYMLDEGATDVFLLLIEAVKTPEKFKRMAEKALNAGKPIIVGKIGQTEPGSRAVISHTAALAGSTAAYRATFAHYGLIEGRDFDEMLDLAAGFLACRDRLPKGNRVGICTASGGAGVWMADACAAAGLEVPLLDKETRAALDTHLPPYATSQNPVDSTAQGVQQLGYAQFARLVVGSPSVDAVVVVITARRSAFLEADLPKLKELARESDKPVFMWTYTLPSERTIEILNESGYPLFVGAHGCARTVRALVDYRAVRERSLRSVETPQAPGQEWVAAALAQSPSVLCEYRARALLAVYGIGPDNAGWLVHSTKEAVAAAQAIGRPVALKVQSADIAHKTETGAVALNLVGDDMVCAAYSTVLAAAKRNAPKALIDGVLVQPMAPPGREVLLGINRDPTWGLLLVIGLGGVLVEVLGNVVLAPVPLNQIAARAIISRLTGAQAFARFRGMPAADTEALADLIVRLSHFAANHGDDIDAIDLNPVIVHAQGEGVSVVDALIVRRDRGGRAA
jgi:acyl-CoA synthetase (NDP forming)